MGDGSGQGVHHPGNRGVSSVAAVFFFLIICTSCATASRTTAEKKPGFSESFFHFYRNVISPVDGDRCQMIPSCSAYTAEVVVQHGWFMGWIMGCDRLIRCGGDETHVAEITVRGDDRFYHDPVDANDFWWTHK
jgi:putative component of membrane protein insertase Oxa1/YidC/SpoIIIJ protein YidD